MLVKITTKHTSNSLVTFVTYKRFAVLLRKLTIIRVNQTLVIESESVFL